MKIAKLERHANSELYCGAVKVIPEQSLGTYLITIADPTRKSMDIAILRRAKTLGANAYEFGGEGASKPLDDFHGAYSFYRISEETIKAGPDGQLGFDFGQEYPLITQPKVFYIEDDLESEDIAKGA